MWLVKQQTTVLFEILINLGLESVDIINCSQYGGLEIKTFKLHSCWLSSRKSACKDHLPNYLCAIILQKQYIEINNERSQSNVKMLSFNFASLLAFISFWKKYEACRLYRSQKTRKSLQQEITTVVLNCNIFNSPNTRMSFCWKSSSTKLETLHW